MLSLVIFLLCCITQSMGAMDNIIDNEVTIKNWPIGYVDIVNKCYMPFNRQHAEMQMTDKEISYIQETPEKSVRCIMRNDVNYACLKTDCSLLEVGKFFKRTNLKDDVKNYISAICKAAGDFESTLLECSEIKLSREVMPLLSTLITERCHIARKSEKDKIKHFLETSKKCYDNLYSNSELHKSMKRNVRINISFGIILIIFLYGTIKNEEILAATQKLSAPYLAMLSYAFFILADFNEFLRWGHLYDAHKKYTAAYEKLLNDIDKS